MLINVYLSENECYEAYIVYWILITHHIINNICSYKIDTEKLKCTDKKITGLQIAAVYIIHLYM
jgi:hypothetical protein